MLVNFNTGKKRSKNADKRKVSYKDDEENDTKKGKYVKSEESSTESDIYYEEYYKMLHALREEFLKKWKGSPPKDINIDLSEFEVVRTLGIGAFGRVKLVKHKETSKSYAMKILEKRQLVECKQVKHTRNEKRLLQCVNFPFLINLSYFFMDNSFLYLILPFINGGELFSYLQRKGKFPERQSQFYASQVVLALEYLHYCGIIYRDLKPENILIDREGYLKLTDYGFCKYIEGKRTYTLCGTPEYLAPEVILCQGYGKAVDWWSFGILIYEMNAGYAPFFDVEQMKIFEKIVIGKYRFPKKFNYILKNIIDNLLQADLSQRYGNLKNGVMDIKKHSWFRFIDWDKIYHRKIKPSYIPEVKDDSDAQNFDFHEEEELIVASKDHYPNDFARF